MNLRHVLLLVGWCGVTQVRYLSDCSLVNFKLFFVSSVYCLLCQNNKVLITNGLMYYTAVCLGEFVSVYNFDCARYRFVICRVAWISSVIYLNIYLFIR